MVDTPKTPVHAQIHGAPEIPGAPQKPHGPPRNRNIGQMRKINFEGQQVPAGFPDCMQNLNIGNN
jgi:hypothetical protein